ncbi:MAG: proton-conducting transporter membrane subunit, partial [Candidatus Sumerlaeia bacterium]|nr:proton-conducting transporter membrane subunit [Candidatus Sumerlaeia bacterium]
MNWIAIYPEITLLVLASAILVIDLFVTHPLRRLTYGLALATLAVGGAMQMAYFLGYYLDGQTVYAAHGMVVNDPLGNLLKFFATLSVFVTLIYGHLYSAKRDMLRGGEFFTLSLLALLGIMVMISGNNFLVIYLGLELMSLSLYALVALRRDDLVATEAAMKYFVLGALASGFLLYGLSMMYGSTGSLDIDEVFKAIAAGQVNRQV